MFQAEFLVKKYIFDKSWVFYFFSCENGVDKYELNTKTVME